MTVTGAVKAMIVGQKLNKIEKMYDTVAEEYSKTFFSSADETSNYWHEFLSTCYGAILP